MDRSYVEDSEDAGEASDTSTDSDAPPKNKQCCKTRGHGQASKEGAEEGGASSNNPGPSKAGVSTAPGSQSGENQIVGKQGNGGESVSL